MPLRLGVDATSVSPEGKGISRFQLGLLGALSAEDFELHVTAYVRRVATDLRLPDSPWIEYRTVSGSSAWLWEQRDMPSRLDRDSLDLLLTTTERLPWAAPGSRFGMYLFESPTARIRANFSRPRESGPHQLMSDVYTFLTWRHSLRRAKAVIFPSNSTRAAVEGHLRGGHVRLAVISPGLDPIFLPRRDPEHVRRARERFSSGRPYVLHIASDDARDHSALVVRTFARACAGLGGTALVIAGRLGRLSGPLLSLIRQLSLGDHVFLPGRIPDEDLACLYQAAEVYLDPTLYEGFGLQPLEAMACGTPVITSGRGAVSEMVGSAALVVDQLEEGSWADALVHLLTDLQLRESLSERARIRAGAFRWSRAAERLAALLHELVTEEGTANRVAAARSSR